MRFSSTFIQLNCSCLMNVNFKKTAANIYPLVGVDIDIGKNNFTSSNNDRVWLGVGAGSDIYLSKRLCLRPQALVGFHVNNPSVETSGSNKYFGYKFDIGIGAGYKF